MMKQKSRADRERKFFNTVVIALPLQSVLKCALLPVLAEMGCHPKVEALLGFKSHTNEEWISLYNVKSCYSLLN